MASITLNAVSKTYSNDVQAVDDVSLDIADGELMVLVGPSGCGKTTLMRMISGLERVTAGQIKIGDRDVTMAAPKERDVAMVFQNYALYPHMTVAENIGFPLRLRGVGKREIATKVAAATEILGLSQSESRRPPELSGGQRQRVAMGRAIVREPSVFLMDEPLSNLDAKLRVQMRTEVSRIQQRLGAATLYVTHDQTEAMTMGSRVAVMRNGLVEQCDAPQVLYDRPVNLFVAAFIGSPAMNLYEAVVGADGRSLRLGSQEIALDEAAAAARPGLDRYRGQKVIAGLRPEHLPAAGPADEAVLEGDVDLVEALGNELLVHFSIDAQRTTTEGASEEEEQLTTRGAGVARIDTRTPMVPGRRGRFAVDIERMQLFDPRTEQAIWD